MSTDDTRRPPLLPGDPAAPRTRYVDPRLIGYIEEPAHGDRPRSAVKALLRWAGALLRRDPRPTGSTR